MAYSLFIDRLDPPLQLEEWLAAIDAHEAVRRTVSDENAPLNPFNGEPMKLKILDGDAEVFDDGDWMRMFSWRTEGNAASFNSRAVARAMSIGDMTDPTWKIVADLARTLGGRVSGEEGETYNLETAKPTQS